MVFVVNAVAAALLFPRDYELDSGSGWHTACLFAYKFAFFGLILASFGAGSVAAFLWKRATAHARSACGYAVVNWFQSILGSLTFLKGPFDSLYGCRYGFLPAERDFVYDFHVVVVCCRAALYLLGLFWMQMLIAARLSLLEQTLSRKYCSGCFRKLVFAQAFSFSCIIVAPFTDVWLVVLVAGTVDLGVQYDSQHCGDLFPRSVFHPLAEGFAPC